MSVRVVHGANEDHFTIAGVTVALIAKSLKDVFNIPSDASAFIDGHGVTPEHIIVDGDTVEFLRTHGAKGGNPDFWSAEDVVALLGEDAVHQMAALGIHPITEPVFTHQQVVGFIASNCQHDSKGKDRLVNVDFSSMTLRFGNGEPIPITGALEFRLLSRFAARPGSYVDLDTLKLDVWDDHSGSTEDETVHRAARKLRRTLQGFQLSGVTVSCKSKRWALLIS